jgi:hypothetical protein
MKELKLFFHRLLDRGYQSSQLTPLFQQAMDNAKIYLQRTALRIFECKMRAKTQFSTMAATAIQWLP